MLSPQQHGHGNTFKAGRCDVELAIRVDIPHSEIVGPWSGTERRARCRHVAGSTTEKNRDTAIEGGRLIIHGRRHEINFLVSVDIDNSHGKRLSLKEVR